VGSPPSQLRHKPSPITTTASRSGTESSCEEKNRPSCGVTPSTGYDIEGRAHELLDAHRKEGEWFLVPASIAIGATLEAASRLGEPIQQVAPEIVPQIIYLANQPDPNAPSEAAIAKYNKRWGILAGLPWWLRYPIKTIAAIIIFTIVALSTLFIVFLLTH